LSTNISCTCGKRLAIADHMAGKKVRCPACQNVLRVPADIATPILEAEPVTDIVHSPTAPVPAKKREFQQDSSLKAKARRRLSRAVVWFCVFLRVSGLGTCGAGAAVVVWKFLGSVDRVMIGKWELDKEATAKLNPLAAAIPSGLVYEFARDSSYKALDGETGAWGQLQINSDFAATEMLIQMNGTEGHSKVNIQIFPENKLLFTFMDQSGRGLCVMKRVDSKSDAASSGARMVEPPAVQPHRRFDKLKQDGFHATRALSISDDATRAVVISYRGNLYSIQILDLESAKVLVSLDDVPRSLGIAMAPDGKTVAIAGSDEVALIDVDNGTFIAGAFKRLLSPKSGPVGLSFSAKGDLLCLGSAAALEVWDVKSRTLRYSLQLPEETRAHLWSPLFAGNRKIALAKERSDEIEIRDLETGKITATFNDTEFRILATIGLSHDNKKLAIGQYGIRVFGLDDHKLVHFIPRVDNAVFLGDSKSLAYSWGTKIFLIDLESGQKRAALAGLNEPPHCMDVTPDGKFLVATDDDATVLRWDLKKLP
jgi:hypothetical protein